VTSPWHETKHFGDFLLEVSKRLGGAIAEALPWEHYESYLKLYAEAVFNTGEGAIVSQSHEYSWTEFLRERGWSEYDYSSFEEFWEVLTEQGAWWSPYDPDSDYKRILKTESGKFEFYSQSFQLEAERLLNHFESEPVEDVNLSRNWKLDAHGDRVFLPHFEAPRYRREHSDFPFHFLAYRRLTNLAGAAGTCSLVQELSGLHSREYWHSWVEINPETARTLDVGEDDYVAITSPVGRLVAKAKLLPTVMPNVVVMPLGLGHQISGRYPGLNPYRIFVEETDLLSGTPSLVSTRVQIQKVEGQSKS
jgi:anaerobic selenocysteine-containing dehydrogenase